MFPDISWGRQKKLGLHLSDISQPLAHQTQYLTKVMCLPDGHRIRKEYSTIVLECAKSKYRRLSVCFAFL